MSSKSLQQSIERLVTKDPGWHPLGTAPAVGARPASKAVGRPGGTQQTSGSFDFIETLYSAREYWPAVQVTSSDGVFTLEIEPIKSILLDTGERAQFQEPT